METRQMHLNADFQTRSEDGGKKYIEGYFAVFGKYYDICDGGRETIAPGAFTDTLGGDIRALINHDTSLVLGRTKAGTLTLRQDEKGLWGRIEINPNDTDALNIYNRVQRGDVDQCSFGFTIDEQDTEVRDDMVTWTIRKVTLFEVSVCTFPAYKDTSVTARQKDADEARAAAAEAWRQRMMSKLKGA